MSFLYNEFLAFLTSIFVILSVAQKTLFESLTNALYKFAAFFFSSSIAVDDFSFDITRR